jgi:hypothetical protein
VARDNESSLTARKLRADSSGRLNWGFGFDIANGWC